MRKGIVALGILAALGDAITTGVAIRMGGVEVNPIFHRIIDFLGVTPALVVRVVVGILVVVGLNGAYDRISSRKESITFWGVTLIGLMGTWLVVATNAYEIARFT